MTAGKITTIFYLVSITLLFASCTSSDQSEDGYFGDEPEVAKPKAIGSSEITLTEEKKLEAQITQNQDGTYTLSYGDKSYTHDEIIEYSYIDTSSRAIYIATNGGEKEVYVDDILIGPGEGADQVSVISESQYSYMTVTESNGYQKNLVTISESGEASTQLLEITGSIDKSYVSKDGNLLVTSFAGDDGLYHLKADGIDFATGFTFFHDCIAAVQDTGSVVCIGDVDGGQKIVSLPSKTEELYTSITKTENSNTLYFVGKQNGKAILLDDQLTELGTYRDVERVYLADNKVIVFEPRGSAYLVYLDHEEVGSFVYENAINVTEVGVDGTIIRLVLEDTTRIRIDTKRKLLSITEAQ